MLESLLFLGTLTAVSFIILIRKIEKKKWSSLIADGLVTVALLVLFSSTLTGLGIAIIAGLLLSIYFYFFEPDFIEDNELLKDLKD